jgi:hypothetical protein
MEPLTHKINIVIGSVLFIKLTYHFINNKKLYNLLAQLEKYAFFVYASLGIVLAAMQKLSAKIIPMRGGWLLLQYFGVNIVGIAILVMIGMIFRKILPKPYAILTGGRI